MTEAETKLLMRRALGVPDLVTDETADMALFLQVAGKFESPMATGGESAARGLLRVVTTMLEDGGGEAVFASVGVDPVAAAVEATLGDLDPDDQDQNAAVATWLWSQLAEFVRAHPFQDRTGRYFR